MELTLTARRAGRLSSFLKGELKMSTGLVNKVKWADGLRVNGAGCHTDYPVRPGDVVTVLLEEEAPEYPAEEGPLIVLYEDGWLPKPDHRHTGKPGPGLLRKNGPAGGLSPPDPAGPGYLRHCPACQKFPCPRPFAAGQAPEEL